MAANQGNGGTGLLEGNTSRHTRSRKRDKVWCLLCLNSGRKSRLQLFQIGGNEAMYLCSNETCPYPVSMSDDLHSSVVSRELTELKVSSPQKTTSGNTMKKYPTSMPIVVPVEVQKMPTMPREDGHSKRNSISDLTEDSILQFKLWMRGNKRSFRSNSLTQEESINIYKNGDLRERDIFTSKRVRIKSTHLEADSETDVASRNRIVTHTNKLSSKAPRHFSTPSIRKIDKTLMEASGVNVDKKFEPFKITPKASITKPIPEETENPSQNVLTNHEEDPLATQPETLQNNLQENNIVDNNVSNNLSGDDGIQNGTEIMQMNSLQMPLLSPEQWPHTPQPMQMQNGHVDSVYNTPLIAPPPYIPNNYHMMSQYNQLIPPPSNYHNMPNSVPPPPLQTPLSPMPQPTNNYTNDQFYYPDNLYTDYAEQWDDLELTKMLDAIDMPPTDQYDPTLGILPPGTSPEANMYGMMDPNTMTSPNNITGPYDRPHPSLQMPINSPLLTSNISNSLPLTNNTNIPVSSQIMSPGSGQESGIVDNALKDIVYNVDTNNTDKVTTFNNHQESPMSSYQSPLSQGEYQNLSLVGSAT
ncbi:hypothetical protein LOD99_13078 [Oopsacas minuta]|uniref:Uncharacterized protein n=1 Tax=Oopsacas minuta TaxID=111878 RepID=A0AAV7JAV3_9METZ|nr:hypothetical protein LOD99_13078 [Oopsacas minuta]